MWLSSCRLHSFLRKKRDELIKIKNELVGKQFKHTSVDTWRVAGQGERQRESEYDHAFCWSAHTQLYNNGTPQWVLLS